MRRKEEASAFIIALGILVILFIMAITFATMMIMESRAARNYNDAALCEDVAYGALEEAINALFRDKYGEDASVVAGSLVLQPYNGWGWASITAVTNDTITHSSDGTEANRWVGATVMVYDGTEPTRPFKVSRSVTASTDTELTVSPDWPAVGGPAIGDIYSFMDENDENYDYFAYDTVQYIGDPDLWFKSDGGCLSEDASSTLITDADKSWPIAPQIWPGAALQVAGQMRTVASNGDDNITVSQAFDPEPRQGDRYMVFYWYPRDAADNAIVRPLPGGLSARYAILITDDSEARVNVNTAGNLAVVGPTHGSNMGASVTEVSLEALLGLFDDRDGVAITLADAQTLARDIILARCDPPDTGSTQPGDDTDDDLDDGDDGVDNNGDGVVDETNENLNEDDEFNSLFAVEDTPFALPDEAAILASPADTGDVTSSGASSLTDDTKSWIDNEWTDAVVGVDTNGDGILDEFRRVTGNTVDSDDSDGIEDSDTLDVSPNWATSPSVDDAYAIYYGSPLEAILANTNASLRVGATGTPGLTLADSLTTYSAGTIEHPFLDDAALFGAAAPDYIYRRYRFGLNQFNIDTLNDTQVADLRDILENRGGLTEDQAYQFIVNLKDALDGDSTVTNYLTYYGVELRPFITEVMQYIPPPPPAYYYIEFYNPSPDVIDISGWEVVITDGPALPGLPVTVTLPAGATIPGGGFYVIGGSVETYVDWQTDLLQRSYPPGNPPDNVEISAIELTCIGEPVLPDGTIIDRADGFGLFTSLLSQERHDFKVNEWTNSTAVAGHTFGEGPLLKSGLEADGIDNNMDGVVDEAGERGFQEKYELFILPLYRDLDNDGEIGGIVDLLDYDINIANLGDLSRVLLTSGYSTNPADPALSQKFKDLKDNEASTPAETDIYDSKYRLIKFDISYTDHRQVLDYFTILNPMGDGYDDDRDGTADDTGPTGLVPAGADDLGGPEHRIPGMININTASREVLMALPGIDAFESDGVDNDGDAFVDESGEAADVIDIIIANRPYTEIDDLFAVNGFNQGSNDVDDDGDLVIDEADEKEADYIAFGKISNIITTRSNVFTVYCLAQVGVWNDLNGDDEVDPGEFTTFAERKLMAIVDRSTQPINVRFQRWLTD